MKSLTGLLSLVAINLSSVGIEAAELAIVMRANRETVAKMVLRIDGDMATATVGDEVEQFNLKDMSWLDARTGQWVTLAQCKEFAEQSKAKTVKTLGNIDAGPEQIRAFVSWSLDPTFKAEKSDDTLRLTSGQVDYVVEGIATKENFDEYFRYAVINSYKKFIVEKKFPPYAELEVVPRVVEKCDGDSRLDSQARLR